MLNANCQGLEAEFNAASENKIASHFYPPKEFHAEE
jgi:hypothetical protein